jgi:hypothetical protein
MSEENLSVQFEASETTQVQMDALETVELLRTSAEFFIHFFLGEELTYDIPQFHKDTFDLMCSDVAPNIACALPRGTAKTTLARLAVVKKWLFSPTRFIIYVSSVHSASAESCKTIIDFLQTPNFEAIFGKCEFEVFQDSRGFYKFWLPYYDEAGMIRRKFCILRAIGAGQKIRGTNIDNVRPEMAVVDDLEDDDNTETKDQIRKLKKWFFGPFIKALTRKNPKIIFIGNMLSNQSLLYHFCENSDEWYSLRFGILKSDGTPLWPDLWGMEAIRKDFIEYQRLGLIGKWFAEMMNMPIPDGNTLIASEDIRYRAPLVPGTQEYSFITVDPAISQKTWADETAIAVHAAGPDLKWQVVDYVKGKFTPDYVFLLLLDMCNKWRTRVVGVEMAGYQAALKYLFDVLMQVHKQSFSVYEVPHRNKSKLERIAAWCSLIRKDQWALTEGDYAITEQLLQYDPAKKENVDDLIDACSMGATMTTLYMPAIMQAYDIDKDMYKVTYVNSH